MNNKQDKTDKRKDAKVIIPELTEPTVLLYGPGDEFIGEIRSELILTDVQVQIKSKNLAGYYIMFGDIKIRIDKYGTLEDYPEGLYDLRIDLLLKLN